jgi:hypothetical protein
MKIMKKITLAVAVLMSAAVGMGVAWAQTIQQKEKPQWVLDHEKEHALGYHSKKGKPVLKISGTAKRGAKQVSPLVVKKAP